RLYEQSTTRADSLALIAAVEEVGAIPRVSALAADVKQPDILRHTAIQTLGQIPSVKSVKALESLISLQQVDLATEAVRALGMQIPMWTEGPGTGAALLRLQTLTANTAVSPALRKTAATTLAETRAGAIWLLRAQANHQLADALKPEVGRL